ncbi:unnamed protein product [Arabidopsis halleri]
MAWTGIEDNTAFVNVIRPAMLRNRLFQPDNLEDILSSVSPKVSLLIRFCNTGIPKYLPKSRVDLIPLSSLICFPKSLDTFFEK